MNILDSKTKFRAGGMTLPLVMVAILILVVVGVGLAQLDMQSQLMTVRETHDILARTAADSGLVKGVSQLNQLLETKPWKEDALPVAINEALPEADGTFSYKVTGTKADGYTIESTGDTFRCQKKVFADLGLKGLFEFAVFTKQNLILKNGTSIDWYIPDASGDNLKVGTNSIVGGSVDAKTGVTINGDVLVGVGGDPDTVVNSKKLATITGETGVLQEEQSLPIIGVPEVLKLAASSGSITGSTTLSASGRYDKIDVKNSSVIKVDKPVVIYVEDGIILDNAGSIEIDPNSPDASLTIFVGGNIEFKNGGEINNLTKDPTKLKIFGLEDCKNIDLKTAGTLYGTIYAPNADVRSHNSVQIYGALVANSFIQDVSANLWYDASLRDVSYDDFGVRFTIDRWYEE